jgi:hypothetical protein
LATAKDDALKALTEPENEAVELTIGPLLRQQLDQDGWEEIILLQHLAQSSPRLEGWNGLFSRARKALANPNDLAAKGAQLLGKVRGLALQRRFGRLHRRDACSDLFD